MASRYFNQFLNTLNFQPVYLEGSFVVGNNGAVVNGSVVGSGVPASSTLAVKNVGTGLYQIQLSDPYFRMTGFNPVIIPPLGSTALTDGDPNLVVGKPYQIILASTGTNWYTLGLPKGFNPTPGMSFVATSGASQMPGSSAALVGNGTMALIKPSNIGELNLLPGYNLELAPTTATVMDNGAGQTVQVSGSVITFGCSGVSSSGAYVMPTSGTVIRYGLILRNSSRLGFNESSSAN